MVKRPDAPNPGTAEADSGLQTIIPAKIGLAEESKGDMVPLHLVDTFISLRVGQMKAEMQREFAGQLDKIDALPTKWQLIAGGASAVVITVGLLFGILSYFGDRQDSAIDRSATLSEAITRVDGRLERIEEQSDGQSSRDEIRPSPRGHDRP